MSSHRLAFVILVSLGVACGGGGGDPPDAAPPDPPDAEPPIDAMGIGSLNLLVVGTCVVEDTNNMTSGQYRVNCEMRVTKDGAPVNNAIVTLNPAPPAFQTTLSGEALEPNHYTGNYTPYANTVRITITTGAGDYVGETVLSGPQLYLIEQPLMGSAVPTTMPLHISWSQPMGAEDSADVELDSGYAALGITDTGVHDIPAASLAVGADELIVTRWRRNILPGAAPGSYLDFGARNHVTFTGN